jgi:hypothetical protein
MLSFFQKILARLRGKAERQPVLPPMGHWDPTRAVHPTPDGAQPLQNIKAICFGADVPKRPDDPWPPTQRQE